MWEKSVGFKATEHILAEHHVTDEIDSPTRFASFKFHGNVVTKTWNDLKPPKTT